MPRKPEYKPLLYTTTIRNPERFKDFMHKSIKTTQIYLKGFELSERTKVNRLNYSYVMNFKTI